MKIFRTFLILQWNFVNCFFWISAGYAQQDVVILSIKNTLLIRDRKLFTKKII